MAAQRKLSPVRSYLSKDYASFRSDLLRYARTFFPDQIQDFSEASVGGLFLDMSAAVADNMSFYLDHQFRETIWSDAVETANIERMIKNSGVKITGASPSVVDLTFYIEVPAVVEAGVSVPNKTSLPVIQEGTLVTSRDGVPFTTVEDLDFAEEDRYGELTATVEIGSQDFDGTPVTFVLSKNVVAVSGKVYVETFSFGSEFIPFRTITLGNDNVTEILSVVDSTGDQWYEVDSLTQDTAFVGIPNLNEDKYLVKKNLKVVPAPKRYMTSVSLQDRTTTLMFGSGDPTLYDDDVFPDPSKLVVPMYGKNNISRFSIDPNNLLKSRTMGIAPVSTILTVAYRAGGGVSHNVGANFIRTIKTLRIDFRNGSSSQNASFVRASVDVINNLTATGASQAPTIDSLRALIPAARSMQSRIVTKADLLARVYSLPTKFGSVFRAGIRENPNNPLASQLFVLSRDSESKLIVTPDSLKNNLKAYLNEYRLISDALDIVDAKVINLGVSVTIIPDPISNPPDVVKNVIIALQEIFATQRIQIDQPISTADVMSSIINVPGVISLTRLEFYSITGLNDGREYANTFFDVEPNTIKGLIIGPPGSIFEMKYPNFDIIVSTN